MANDKREQDLGHDGLVLWKLFVEASRKIWGSLFDQISDEVRSHLYDLFKAGHAAATAEGIPQADGWVDVADRLPEAKEGWNHSEQCLVWYQPSLDAVGNYGVAYYHYDPPYRPCEWVDFAHLGRDPIAWQPLPAPYQRQSREGEEDDERKMEQATVQN